MSEKKHHPKHIGKNYVLKLSEEQELVFAEVDQDGPEKINPDWRRTRQNQRGRKRSLPSTSPQELQLWLQQGGWKFVAGLAVLVIVGIVVVLSINRTAKRQPALDWATAFQGTEKGLATNVPETGNSPHTLSVPKGDDPATASNLPTPLPSLGGSSSPASSERTTFVVVNTGAYGLRLRADHVTSSPVLEILRDGMRVEKIGEDFTGPDYVWRKVRTPSGKEGWVAVDWLQPLP